MSLLVIAGLRRSGTTIFWKWFRQDQSLRCYDEPFSEQLMLLPQDHSKGIFAEYQALMDPSPESFWNAYAPIHRSEELDHDFTPRQRAYLHYLNDSAEDVVLDLTRCHLKIPAIVQEFPDAKFLHLVRDERAFATSHLLPTRTDRIGKLRRRLLMRDFFTRTNRFDFWGMQMLAGTAPGSKLSLILEAEGHDVAGFYRLPAVGQLVAMHRLLGGIAQRDIDGAGGAVVHFEQFAADPDRVVQDVCQKIGYRTPTNNGTVSVNEGALPFRHDDERWASVLHDVDQVIAKGSM